MSSQIYKEIEKTRLLVENERYRAALRWIVEHHRMNRLHPNIAELLAERAERALDDR